MPCQVDGKIKRRHRLFRSKNNPFSSVRDGGEKFEKSLKKAKKKKSHNVGTHEKSEVIMYDPRSPNDTNEFGEWRNLERKKGKGATLS